MHCYTYHVYKSGQKESVELGGLGRYQEIIASSEELNVCCFS